MKRKYYFFELDDYATPSFVSGTLKYLGTKTGFKRLLQGTKKEMSDLRETFDSFCNGKKNVMHYAAYAERRFATSVTLVKRKKVLLESGVFEHTNIWGFPYIVHTDGTELSIYLVKQKKMYYIYYRAKVKNPRVEIEAKKVGQPMKFMEIGDMCWGFPGILRYSQKDGVSLLENNLMVFDSRHSSESEAIAKFNQMENVDMTHFYNEVFGDG